MRKVWLTLAFLTLAIALIAYAYLGGFNDPKLTVKEENNIVVVGFPYEGQLNKPEFAHLFTQADSLVDNKIVDGKVAGIFYNQPEKSKDSVKTFIGVIPSDTNLITNTLEKRVFPVKKAVEADLKAHYLIMPVNIYPRIYDYAKENNLELAEESIEIYESNKHLRILSPLKD